MMLRYTWLGVLTSVIVGLRIRTAGIELNAVTMTGIPAHL